MTHETSPQQQLAQVNQLAQQRQLKQALSLVENIIQEYPKFAPAWFTAAFLYFQSNIPVQAEQALKQARQLEPDNLNFAFQEIMMLDAMNRPDEALRLAQELIAKTLPDGNMSTQLAGVFEKNEDFKSAQYIYSHLSSLQPQHIGWLLKSAMIEQNLGDIAAAEVFMNRALAIEPDNPDVLFFRSHLKKQSNESNHIEALTVIRQKNLSNPTNKAKIYFALAKELEDCQQYEASFNARKTGADIYRQSYQYDVNSDLQFMRQLRSDFNSKFVDKDIPGYKTEEPIFIVGLPRSGTTLLDRIISSHSDVIAAGELKQFNRCMLQGLQSLKLNPNLSRTEMVTASTQLDFLKLGETYLRNSRTRTGSSPRFTDKFPQNSYYVGMILKALPQAKVIIMQRHPVAVCYSVYKQMFNHDSYPYSYKLDEMADYYIEHNKLLNHWQEIGGDAVKTVYYEDLVSDLESQAKSILAFLNLSWQPECLDFHKNRQPTATASASQVRQKLYSSSVELWRHYESQLQPMIDKLQAAGCLSGSRFDS